MQPQNSSGDAKMNALQVPPQSRPLVVMSRPTSQPPPRQLMPTSSQLAAASAHRIQKVESPKKVAVLSAGSKAGSKEAAEKPTPDATLEKPKEATPASDKKPEKRKRSESESEEEDDPYDEDDDESDDDDENDSIVVPDEEDEVVDDLPDDEDDPENARKITKVLVEEASEFIKKPLQTSCVGGRSLRDRSSLKQPKEKLERDRIIAEAYEMDEKKELIKEIGIWKRKLCKEAEARNIVWPQLKTTMTLADIRAEHEKVRKGLGLESSDDEESEAEEEEEDESASMDTSDTEESETESED
jgi:hypothetical protein